MEMTTITVTGKTKIGSHLEQGKDGKNETVNDYDYAVVNIEVPTNPTDDAEFYGVQRQHNMLRAHEIVLVGNLTRSTLLGSKGKDQDEKNAIAQVVIGDNYPICLDTRIKVPGAARVPAKIKRAFEARQTALNMMEGLLKKSYDKWSEKAQVEFDQTYPVPTAE